MRVDDDDEDEGTELNISDDDGDGEEGEEAEGEEDDGSDVGDDDSDDDGEEEEGEEDESEEGEEDEGDDEGEEEGEADDDALDPDIEDLAADDPPEHVPYSRFSAVVNELNELKRAAKKKPEDPPEPEFDLKAKLKAKNDALLDGDTEKATEIDLEIATHQQKVSDARAEARVIQARNQEQVNKAVRYVQKKYAALNDAEGNKAFDPEALVQVVALRDAYVQRGMSTASALIKAADRHFNGKAKASGEGAGKPKEGGGKKEKLSETQRLKKLLRAKKAASQPPPTGNRGKGNKTSPKVDLENLKLENMSDEQLENLAKTNPRLMAKLQGDVL